MVGEGGGGGGWVGWGCERAGSNFDLFYCPHHSSLVYIILGRRLKLYDMDKCILTDETSIKKALCNTTCRALFHFLGAIHSRQLIKLLYPQFVPSRTKDAIQAVYNWAARNILRK